MFTVITILLLLKNFDETLSTKIRLRNITTINDSRAAVVVDIVKTCFYQCHNTITVAGNWTDFVTWHRLLIPHLSINLIALQQSKIFERHKRLKKVLIITEDVVHKLHYPNQLFVLSVPTESLNELFERLRDSTMWNSRAMFFLVNENLDKGCFNSMEALRIAWSYNVLNAVYVCRDSKGKINMFDFNPFANDAEAPWEVVDVAVDEDRGHPFTINRLSLDSEDNVTPTICQALHHDKTIHLNGYPIRLGAFQIPLLLQLVTSTKSHYGLSDFIGRDAWIGRLLWNKLRANLTIDLDPTISSVELHGKQHGLMKKIIESRVDMTLNQCYYNNFWQQQTYPHWTTGICMITKKNGRRFSIVNRLMSISKVIVILLVLITWLMVSMMFRCLMGMRLGKALIVVLHMVLATPTGHTHCIVNYRFFFTSMALLMYCMNLYIQSSLTSTFVSRNDVNSIDTVSQLLHSHIPLYGELYNQLHLHDSRLFYRYRNSTVSQCLHWLRNGDNVACTENCYLATEYHKSRYPYLHVSKESISKVDMAFIVREDWPLLERVDSLVQRLKESGMYIYMRNMELIGIRTMGRKLQKEGENGNEPNYVEFEAKPMNVGELGLGWYVLGIGFTVAFIANVVEIVMVKWNIVGIIHAA